ncbi:MAG: tRNA (uridine(34)/cytosine(34)/5-carboxymethylaminomethyluridine(34)-2'-O)-methyltransferase TrmL [Burkholderiales bacterium]|nr:MAG: tRNA (uridine(34)/cytosine(34)/5-carboxymethylaminomethyluridine(34)-2'-O)-methyltransferase TrmL [Betaproteobacteria bacterium]TAG81515.1 MAG: tRNA (uridine(34)/cytosine(34)/5-carboxymethylaminomethyluridine(34)-2'-O)-methyltransferase TrmL [Burkholderiales bacterium]
MISVVLVSPEIPPNTGNVIRLCANTGAELHLVHPLGFPLDDARMRRAGLDYHEYATMKVHDDWAACRHALAPRRLFAIETTGTRSVYDVSFREDDVIVFGSETKGLSSDVLETFAPENVLRIPMRPSNRSLNLSNSVAVTVYEAWRQLHFTGSSDN